MVRTLSAAWAALATFLPFLGPQLPLFTPAHDQVAIEYYWGVYSPFHAVEQYTPPPSGCKVSQVNILHRHGARLPTESQTEDIVAGVNKLLSVDSYTDPRLDFLHTFSYSLEENLLVPLGAMQSFESGETAFRRYASLVKEDDIPFVRASGMSRVVNTALNWSAGFGAASNYKYTPPLSVIISEEGNDTLQDNNCPNAASSHREMRQWFDVFGPPIAARLNAWAPRANISNVDVHGLMMLCAFHTVASVPWDYKKGSPLPFSPFCDLFTPAEFEAFAYSSDIDRYYSTGYGGRLGRVQGVGYTNELLARLTSSPVVDHTSTNTTLDSDPQTFPLDRTIYADFTHDSVLVAVFNTLGLFPTPVLDTRKPVANTVWHTSEMMSFSTRMVVEKLECAAAKSVKKDTFIRIMVNEDVQPLAFCGAAKAGAWRGVCAFDAFLESQAYARNDGDGDWDKCFS